MVMKSEPPDNPALPAPPNSNLPIDDFRKEVQRWLAELHERCNDPEFVRKYVKAHCPPSARVAAYPNGNDLAQQEWERLLGEHSRQLRSPVGSSWQMPEPAQGDELRRWLATMLSPKTQGLAREAIMDLIGPAVMSMILAALKEAMPNAA
jgi:hypothetical protein